MLTREEARRIADAIQSLRSDWSVPQLMGVLGDDRVRMRSYTDTALAMCAIALDETTRQPTRLFDQGPWWDAAKVMRGQVDSYRRPSPLDCAVCSLPEPECRRRPGDHDFDPRPHQKAAPPEGLKSLIATKRTTPDAKEESA